MFSIDYFRWVVVLRIYVASAVFQPYRELEWVSKNVFLTSHATDFSYICDGTMMCRRTEEVGPTVGIPNAKHFVGFFNPVQAPTMATFLCDPDLDFFCSRSFNNCLTFAFKLFNIVTVYYTKVNLWFKFVRSGPSQILLCCDLDFIHSKFMQYLRLTNAFKLVMLKLNIPRYFLP